MLGGAVGGREDVIKTIHLVVTIQTVVKRCPEMILGISVLSGGKVRAQVVIFSDSLATVAELAGNRFWGREIPIPLPFTLPFPPPRSTAAKLFYLQKLQNIVGTMTFRTCDREAPKKLLV